MYISLHGARLGVLSLALGGVFSAYAQSDNPAGDTPKVLKEMVVTATRTESSVSALISDVTVITRSDIEANVGRTLTETIARVAGVQSSSNGGLGKTSSLYIRGTEARHVLLLVDGVRYGSSTSGTPTFDTIPLELIDHIEVLKGPASALYGSDAVGGVVQVFTRKGSGGLHPYASITAGEYNRGEVAAGLAGGTDAFDYAFGAQTLNEQGFSSTNKRSTTFNPDNDGYTQNTVNLSGGWKFAEGWKLSASALQSDGVSQYDAGLGVFNSRIESSGSVYSLALAGKLSSIWKSTLTAGTGIDKALTYATAAAPSKFNTTQNQLTWQNDVQTGWGTLVLGLDNVNEKIDSTTVYAVNSRTTGSQFVGLSGEAGAHSWQTSARHDQNSQFGDANTGLLGYGYAVTDDLRVRGSYGTTFKAPSFNTLYFPVSGNPSTQPETGRNTEVGASYAVGANLISLTYYANRIQGFITSLPVVINIPFAKIEGSTLAIEGSEEGLSYRSALDFMNARNELTGQKLPRRSDWQFTSSLDYVSGAWSYGATVLAVSDFYNDAANLQALGGYTTLDVHVGYVVQKDWTLDGRIMNLGDKFYQTAYGYNQSGRAAYVTLRYAPK